MVQTEDALGCCLEHLGRTSFEQFVWIEKQRAGYVSGSTMTVICAVTSRCSRRSTLCSPTVRIGSSNSILRRSIWNFCVSSASAISFAVTEPNNWLFSPTRWWMVTLTLASIRARSSASLLAFASRRRYASRSCSTIFLFASVAGTARRSGNRKLRAEPSATLTIDPRVPTFSTSSLRMISIANSFLLQTCCKGQKRDVASLLDGFAEPLLMRRAHAGNAARHNLSSLGNEV